MNRAHIKPFTHQPSTVEERSSPQQQQRKEASGSLIAGSSGPGPEALPNASGARANQAFTADKSQSKSMHQRQAPIDHALQMDIQDIAGPVAVVASKGKRSNNDTHIERASMQALSGTTRHIQVETEIQVPPREAARHTRLPAQATYAAMERSIPAREPPRQSECHWLYSFG